MDFLFLAAINHSSNNRKIFTWMKKETSVDGSSMGEDLETGGKRAKTLVLAFKFRFELVLVEVRHVMTSYKC